MNETFRISGNYYPDIQKASLEIYDVSPSRYNVMEGKAGYSVSVQLEYNSPDHGPNNYPFEFDLSKPVSTIDGTFLSNYDPSIQYLVKIAIEKVESSDKSEITIVVASPETPPYDDI